MRILVTGGLGFIGSNFIRLALEGKSSVRVVNLDLRTTSILARACTGPTQKMRRSGKWPANTCR